MFCIKCGKELPDGSAYCGSCGTKQGLEAQTPNRKAAPSKKKGKGKLLITILAVAGGTLIGQGAGKLMAGSYTKSSPADTRMESGAGSMKDYGTAITAEAKEDNPEYTKLFSDKLIVMMPYFVIGQDVASFARETENGGLEIQEYAYKDDIVSALRITEYIDLSAWTDSQIQEADAQMQELIAEREEKYDFVTTTSSIGNSYYNAVTELQGLDDPEVLRTAAEEGFIELTEEADCISMSDSEAMLLELGFVKR